MRVLNLRDEAHRMRRARLREFLEILIEFVDRADGADDADEALLNFVHCGVVLARDSGADQSTRELCYDLTTMAAFEQLQRPLDAAVIHKWSRFWMEDSYFAAEIDALAFAKDDDDTVVKVEAFVRRLRAVAFLCATMGAGHQMTARDPPPRTTRATWYAKAIAAYKYSACLWELALRGSKRAGRPFVDALKSLILLCEARTDPYLVRRTDGRRRDSKGSTDLLRVAFR